MAERTRFEQLQVYRLAEQLADEIWAIATHWNQFEKQTLGRQLVRACDSIGANIAEGTGRGTYQDNRRFVLIARGSLYEAKYWLRRAYRRDLLTSIQVDRVRDIIDVLTPMLNGYLKSIGRVKQEQDEKTGSPATNN